MQPRMIRTNVDGGVEFTNSGNNIINHFEIKAHEAGGLSLSITCNKIARAQVARALREDPILRANITNVTSPNNNANNWTSFDFEFSTNFFRLHANQNEINGLLAVVNQLEPNMANMDEVRNIIAATQFVPVQSPLEGLRWNHFAP